MAENGAFDAARVPERPVPQSRPAFGQVLFGQEAPLLTGDRLQIPPAPAAWINDKQLFVPRMRFVVGNDAPAPGIAGIQSQRTRAGALLQGPFHPPACFRGVAAGGYGPFKHRKGGLRRQDEQAVPVPGVLPPGRVHHIDKAEDMPAGEQVLPVVLGLQGVQETGTHLLQGFLFVGEHQVHQLAQGRGLHPVRAYQGPLLVVVQAHPVPRHQIPFPHVQYIHAVIQHGFIAGARYPDVLPSVGHEKQRRAHRVVGVERAVVHAHGYVPVRSRRDQSDHSFFPPSRQDKRRRRFLSRRRLQVIPFGPSIAPRP